jgi:hypothetical protein
MVPLSMATQFLILLRFGFYIVDSGIGKASMSLKRTSELDQVCGRMAYLGIFWPVKSVSSHVVVLSSNMFTVVLLFLGSSEYFPHEAYGILRLFDGWSHSARLKYDEKA